MNNDYYPSTPQDRGVEAGVSYALSAIQNHIMNSGFYDGEIDKAYGEGPKYEEAISSLYEEADDLLTWAKEDLPYDSEFEQLCSNSEFMENFEEAFKDFFEDKANVKDLHQHCYFMAYEEGQKFVPDPTGLENSEDDDFT